MLKIVKINLCFLLLTLAIYITGCSSGEYDVDQYEVNYIEKTVKVDTLKKITLKEDDKNDKIKEDKNKDSYTYVVQIGAFIIQSNFDRFFDRARQTLGADVYYEQTNNLYKIRIGSFTNRAEAIKFLELVKSKGYSDAFVITKKK